MKIAIHPRLIAIDDDGHQLSLMKGIKLLREIERCGNLRQASSEVGISYRNGWDLLKQMEATLGGPVVLMKKGKGSVVTGLGQRLLLAQLRVEARFSPMLSSMASEVAMELRHALTPGDDVFRIHASHGFAIELLYEKLLATQARMHLDYRGSFDAVMSLARGQCELAGFHVPVGPAEAASIDLIRPFINDRHHVYLLALRRQGLMVERGNPKAIWHIDDLLRPEVRVITRQPGSGTQQLLTALLAERDHALRDLPGIVGAESTHAAVAAAIASGHADCGLGVEAAARQSGLDFVPLLNERYFLACEARLLDHPAMQTLFGLLRDSAFRSRVNALPGYDATSAGAPVSLQQLFGT